ncbi:MAG: TadE/TadG family type IV pilus assembly protein [Solirubrobacteraceae bacterium]
MLVEFALVLPVLLLIIIGFLQIGLAMNAKIDSTHLTAEGARYIVVNQNPGLSESPATTLQNYIRSRADTTFLKTAAVCIQYPTNPETSTSGKVGDPVRVTMTHAYPVVPLVGGKLLPAVTTLPVTSEATMRLEALPTKIPAGCIS